MNFEKEAKEYFESECLHSYADTEEQLKEDVIPAFIKGAELGYQKGLKVNFTTISDYPFKDEYAKTIIKDLLNNSDEYARERAIKYLKGE